MKRWTPTEVESFIREYPINSPEVLMDKYGVSWKSILTKASSLKVKRPFPKTTSLYGLSINKEEIIKLYQSGLSGVKIGKIAGCRKGRILNILKQFGVSTRSPTFTSKKYTIDETYFEKIDREDKAYFLGFLYADGCNTGKHGSVVLNINSKDKDVLEKLNLCIKSNKPIRYHSNAKGYGKNSGKISKMCALAIENKKIVEDIKKLGCTPAKTFTLKFPTNDQVPKELVRHFIRGYFDGDGWITYPKNPAWGVIGNECFIQDVQVVISESLKLKHIKLIPHKQSVGIVKLNYSGINRCKAIYKYLYEDATIYLNRKYNKFNYILNNYPTERYTVFKKPVAKYDRNGNKLGEWPSIKEAAKAVKSNATHISKVCRGLKPNLKGYLWKYNIMNVGNTTEIV